ncbi:MAG: hypothetical protein M3068_15390, partial [Gemmatimonadota bacterium]|nr:hypothetical protein [Gemmatimonadota bacterium]
MLALAATVLAAGGCQPRSDCSPVTAASRRAIADTLSRLIETSYDLSKPGDAVARLLRLYPDSGTVVSATAGQIATSRDSLSASIRSFWENVGRNMRDPRWQWGERHVEVICSTAAVMTFTYRIPHRTPAGMPHEIGGAWT